MEFEKATTQMEFETTISCNFLLFIAKKVMQEPGSHGQEIVIILRKTRDVLRSVT